MELIILTLIIINIPIYKLLFNLIFLDKDDAINSIKYSFLPDIYSLFKGNFLKDKIGELKLGMFILLCTIIIIFEYSAIKYIYLLF